MRAITYYITRNSPLEPAAWENFYCLLNKYDIIASECQVKCPHISKDLPKYSSPTLNYTIKSFPPR